jgi:hypothetical protein
MVCMHVLMNSRFAENPSMLSWLTPSFHNGGVTRAICCVSFVGEGLDILDVSYRGTRWR